MCFCFSPLASHTHPCQVKAVERKLWIVMFFVVNFCPGGFILWILPLASSGSRLTPVLLTQFLHTCQMWLKYSGF